MVIDREEHMIKWMDNEEQVSVKNNIISRDAHLKFVT